MYSGSLGTIRRRISSDDELIFRVPADTFSPVIPTKSLYEPPGFLHLLEAGKWEAAEREIDAVFAGLSSLQNYEIEHLLEDYQYFSGAYLHLAHKNGKLLMKVS